MSAQSYPLSLHDALPIYVGADGRGVDLVDAAGCEVLEQVIGERPLFPLARPWLHGSLAGGVPAGRVLVERGRLARRDRKSTRLNSSHRCISYAVFCLKKK